MRVVLKRNVSRRGVVHPAGSEVDLSNSEIAKLRKEGAIGEVVQDEPAPEPRPEPKPEPVPVEAAPEPERHAPQGADETKPEVPKPRRRKRGKK